MPTVNQIQIVFDATAVQRINAAGQAVTLVQGVSSYVSGASVQPAVAWVVFQPFEMNQIQWASEFLVYATVTAPQPGAVVMLNSITRAAAGWTYTFEDGQFNGADGQGVAYNVVNQMSGYEMYFGLAQMVEVNGQEATCPLDAVPVLLGQEGTFQPTGEFSIFLSTAARNGTVVPDIPASALTFAVAPNQPIAVGFNDATNTFYIVSAESRNAAGA
jgi:hypothetical protein